jgi:hypothetical protein
MKTVLDNCSGPAATGDMAAAKKIADMGSGQTGRDTGTGDYNSARSDHSQIDSKAVGKGTGNYDTARSDHKG